MPSSGYGMVPLVSPDDSVTEQYGKYTRCSERAEIAMGHGLFIEWLESFLAAWEATKDVDIASFAGIEEWDM